MGLMLVVEFIPDNFISLQATCLGRHACALGVMVESYWCLPPREGYFNQPYQQLLQSPQCWCHLCSVYLRQAASEYLESRFFSTYSSHMAWLFSHALIHSRSGLTPPEKAVLTIFSDAARKRKWSCNMPRWF